MKERRHARLSTYMLWPFAFAALAALCAMSCWFISAAAGAAATVFAAIILIGSMVCYAVYRNQIRRDLVTFSQDYAQIQRHLLEKMAIPYALLDDSSRLLWSNVAFREAVPESGRGKPLQGIFAELTPSVYAHREEPVTLHVELGEKRYRAEIRRFFVSGVLKDLIPDTTDKASMAMYALYLFDETEIMTYKTRAHDEQPVVGLLYLDNYDETLESIEEVRRSLLLALIDRKINKYITSMGGVIKKLEKDKYLLVVTNKNLEQMQDDKFNLLEDIKTVNIGNEMAVTVSMGLGIGGTGYSQNYEFARTAIDMALARGGDQAVLKNVETITYYGGKTQSTEKNTRVKARVKAQALRELIEGKEHVLIMGHRLSDVDSIGAAIGIYRAAKYSGKKAHIILNDISSSVKPLLERFAENTDYEEDLFIKSSRALELVDDDTVVVVVDVNRPSYTECQELLTRCKNIVVFDHHRKTRESIENAVLSYVEPYASSASEMVAEILQYYGDKVRLKASDADALYAGIVIDTNNFMNKTGIRTFDAAAFLRRSGADVVRVRKMFRDDMEDYKAKAEAVRNAELYEGCFAISHCGESGGIESPTIIAAQAANELLSIRGVKASFVLTRFDNKVYISARSIDEINVQVIMERMGGGGHMTIAGAQLEGSTVEDATALLKSILTDMKQKGEI